MRTPGGALALLAGFRQRQMREQAIGRGPMPVHRIRRDIDRITGVLPVLTTCFGPRTAAAGFMGTIWPVTSQSNSMRTAASCCFTPGDPCCCWRSFTQAATSNGRMLVSESPRFSHQAKKSAAGARIGAPCVIVVDIGGEEFDVAPVGGVAEIGDEGRHH
jgi:hypothetical protein